MGLDWDKMHREYKERLASEKDPVELRNPVEVKKEKLAARAAHGKHPNSLSNLYHSGRERVFDYDIIAAEYQKGKDVKQIMEEQNCTKATVYRVLRESGVQLRPRMGLNKNLIARLLQEGKSVKEIAEEMGCSTESVRRVKKSVALGD